MRAFHVPDTGRRSIRYQYLLSNPVLRMARKLRVEFPGAIYHVMNCGDRREEIFRDDRDLARFLETMAESCAKTGWLHASLDFK